MKRIACILVFLLMSGTAYGADGDAATKGDLKMLLHNMDKRFEQIDKRLEQIDKRFEQIDRRFDDQKTFMLTIISIFTAIIGGMFYYMVSRFNRHEEKMAQILDRTISAEKIIFTVRTDPVLRKELREALKVH